MSEPTTEPREVGITHPANLLTLTRLVFAPLLFGSYSTPMPTGVRPGRRSVSASPWPSPTSSTVGSLAARMS